MQHNRREVKPNSEYSQAYLLVYGSPLLPAEYPALSADEARHRDRGRRLARRLRRYAPWILPELLEQLAEPLSQLFSDRGGR